ncbi:hypothetical protein EVAR_4481_1 [Eumeta japonica]|uniref:Uncharacterized protein n=1 Tax=Eumeta variegata TaxID=151549 RepID=A0A4C1T0K9_EUMVA|nr:hypothetical protein EVAR_4481_1 [Eumeta japonica]
MKPLQPRLEKPVVLDVGTVLLVMLTYQYPTHIGPTWSRFGPNKTYREIKNKIWEVAALSNLRPSSKAIVAVAEVHCETGVYAVSTKPVSMLKKIAAEALFVIRLRAAESLAPPVEELAVISARDDYGRLYVWPWRWTDIQQII